MSFVHAVLMLYRVVLRCYPASFRATFAAEMEEVLALLLQDAARQGTFFLVRAAIRELGTLLVGALREHWYASRKRNRAARGPLEKQQIVRAQWLARGLALLMALWWASIVALNEDVRADQGIAVMGMVALAIGGLLLGRWHPRLGGWLVAVAWLPSTIALSIDILNSLGGWQRLWVYILTALPFIIAGAILIACDMASPAPPNDSDMSTGAASNDTAAIPMHRAIRLELGSALRATVGVMVLGFTWFVLAIMLLAMTEITLVPWDTVGEPIRPPRGTWQRAVNDFFESGVGAWVPSLLALSASMGSLLARLRIPNQRSLLPWLWASANIVFIALLFATLVLMNGYRDWLDIHDLGYHATWPGILAMLFGILMVGALSSRRLFGGVQGR